MRVLVFTVPALVVPQDMEQSIKRVAAALTRLTKGNTLWCRVVSRWAGLIRAKLEPGQGAVGPTFRLSVRTVVEAQPSFNLPELEKRWRLLLHSLGLAATDVGEAALVQLLEPRSDGHHQARKVCRSSSSWLAPIKTLSAVDVLAYHKVLPTLLDLRARVAV